MKFILIFMLCLFTRSCYGLRASQHYKFSYFSSFKTGIPQDGDQAVGVSLKAVLDVFLESQDGIAIFKLSDINTVEFLEDLGCDQQTEFPEERFQPPKDNVFLSALEQPFRANLRGSQPFSIEYEETDHRWLSNLRKGIANVFKNEILKGNFDTQEKESIFSFFHKGHSVNVFSVEEETIFGTCKVSYEIHEIDDGFIWAENDFLPTRESDSEEGLWRVVRSVNFDKCKDKVTLNSHTINERTNKDEKLSLGRSSVSTYILRGSPGHFDLYSAVVEGVVTFPISLFDEHEALSTTKQKFLLIDQSTNEEIPTLGSNLKHSTTWMHQIWSPFKLPDDSMPFPWIVYANENHFQDPNVMFGSPPLSSDQISLYKVQILETIETASKILTDINYDKESQWHNLPDSLNMVTYYFKNLEYDDIKEIFDHFYKRNVKLEWRLLIDTAAASGSYNAYEAIMDYISEDKLEDFQIRNVFSTLGSSDGVLNVTRVMEYVKQLNPAKNSAWPAVVLNFAHFLSEFCTNKAHNFIPGNELFYKECVNVETELGRYLHEIITNETFTWERTFAIRAIEELETSGHFGFLSNIIVGRFNITSNSLRAMALRALKNRTPLRDRQQSLLRKPAMDLLKDVYTNFNEDFEVRAAALVSFLSWQPSTSFWYKLAQSTWHEPSKDFSSFTSYLINLYAEEGVPALEKQWKDAYSASKLAKAPRNHPNYSHSSIFDIFFKNYARLSVLGGNEKTVSTLENLIFQISSKETGFNLFKFESYLTYSKPKNEDKDSYKHHPNGFFDKFLKEIGHSFGSHYEKKYLQPFFEILGDSPSTISPKEYFDHVNFQKDAEDGSIYYGGRFLRFIEEHNFFPNDLGLPFFTINSLPATFSITTKKLPQKPGQVYADQVFIRASAVHTKAAVVYLPWSLKNHIAAVRSSVELNIPVGQMMKRLLGTEGPVRTTKTYFHIAFEKKFPVIRLTNTPMASIYSFGAVSPDDTQLSFIPIKKLSMKEKNISEVDPFTGIKYDLVMRADAKSDFGLHDFQPFPRIPFRIWALEFYINKEESETKDLLLTVSEGILKKSGATEESIDSKEKYPTISNSDTFYERTEKLTSLFGDSVKYIEFKYNLIGEKERSYEIFSVHNMKLKSDTIERIGFTRTQIPGISSTPASFCFDVRKKGPSRAERDSFFLSHRNISQEIYIKFLFNCSQPILKAHGLYSMSKEGREETVGKCNSKYDNTEFNGKLNLLYDTIDIDATYDLESYDLIVAEDAFNFIRNFVNFPSLKGFTDESHQGNVSFKVQRKTYHKNWDFYLKTSSEDVFLATFSDTFLFKFVSGVSGYFPVPVISSFVGQRDAESSDKCILQMNSVTRFDGLHYRYQPSTCWTLVAHYRPEWFSNDKSAFLIRASKSTSKIPDFKFLNFNWEFEIEFSNNEVKVNGTVVDRLSDDSSDLKTIEKGLIYKSGQHYFIYFNPKSNSPSVIVSNDKIEISDKNFEKSPANGLCGNSDGKTNRKFIGPKHCVYYDAQLFAASWTGQSDTCDAATLGEYRQGVSDYQAECKTYQKHEQDVQMNQRCLTFGFHLTTFEENKYCISANPVPFCANECHVMRFKSVKELFKCWPKEKAPPLLKSDIENKVTYIFEAIPVEPYSYEQISNEVATYCKRNI